MNLRFAFNTSGACRHRLDDLLILLAEAGYQGVALTLDHHHFDPFAPSLGARAEQLAHRLQTLGLGLVVETGAPYLLDPRRKYEPTMISPEPAERWRRLELLTRAFDVAAACGAETVSFWTGVPGPGVGPEDARDWLEDSVAAVLDVALERGVAASLQPRPGMLIETVDDWLRLNRTFPSLRLAVDVATFLVTEDRDPETALVQLEAHLGAVALSDVRRGMHDQLPLGKGDLDVAGVLRGLHTVAFGGLVCVELSRESHRAHEAIPETIRYLQSAEAALW